MGRVKIKYILVLLLTAMPSWAMFHEEDQDSRTEISEKPVISPADENGAGANLQGGEILSHAPLLGSAPSPGQAEFSAAESALTPYARSSVLSLESSNPRAILRVQMGDKEVFLSAEQEWKSNATDIIWLQLLDEVFTPLCQKVGVHFKPESLGRMKPLGVVFEEGYNLFDIMQALSAEVYFQPAWRNAHARSFLNSLALTRRGLSHWYKCQFYEDLHRFSTREIYRAYRENPLFREWVRISVLECDERAFRNYIAEKGPEGLKHFVSSYFKGWSIQSFEPDIHISLVAPIQLPDLMVFRQRAKEMNCPHIRVMNLWGSVCLVIDKTVRFKTLMRLIRLVPKSG